MAVRVRITAGVATVLVALGLSAPAPAQEPPFPAFLSISAVEALAPIAGEHVAYEVSVSPVPDGGTVTATTGALTSGPKPLEDGEATVSVGPLPAGTHTITFTYSGDGTVGPGEGTRQVEVLTAHESFLQAAYLAVLTRRPDPAGREGWTAALEGGASYDAVARAIGAGDEARGVAVTLAYWRAVDRAPDAAGRAHWKGQLAAGVPFDDVLARLLASGEAAGHGLDDPEALVDRLYRLHLERGPDPAGAAYWEGRLGEAPTAAVRRSVALAFGRTAGVAEATVSRFIRSCPNSSVLLPETPDLITRRWVAEGRNPVRLAASVVGLVCPRLP